MPPPISQLHDDGAGDGVSAFGAVWAKEEDAATAIATAVNAAALVSFVMDFSFAVVSEGAHVVNVAWRLAGSAGRLVTPHSGRGRRRAFLNCPSAGEGDEAILRLRSTRPFVRGQ